MLGCQSVLLVSRKDIYKIDEVRALSMRTFLLDTKQNEIIIATWMLGVRNHGRYSSQIVEEALSSVSRVWGQGPLSIGYPGGEEMG
jgi:hypothetical protein